MRALKAKLLAGIAQQGQSCRVQNSNLFDQRGHAVRIGRNCRKPEPFKPFVLDISCPGHTLSNRGACLSLARPDQVRSRNSGNFDPEVDPIEQRTGDS